MRNSPSATLVTFATLLLLAGCTTLSTAVLTPTATPAFSPGSGSYASAQAVTITDVTAGATVYYTTDGTAPTTASTRYTAPITVASSEVVEAIALATGYPESAVATAAYTITPAEPVTAKPVFSPTPGINGSGVPVTITDKTPGAAIYYTTNGTIPTASSTLYTGPITVSATTTFEAIAIATGYQNSELAEATYAVSLTSGQWTWMAGSQMLNAAGVYGTKGVEVAANTPGSRGQALAMTDSSGGFWLFGGTGGNSVQSGFLNDLWQYDTATNEWTWVSGSNQLDSSGSYGNKGVPAATNAPPARAAAGAWADKSGNLWIFGGYTTSPGRTQNQLNDMWEYSPVSQQWTWVSGSDIANQDPDFGSAGVAAASNTPGNLTDATSCSDSQGNLWLFGGVGTIGSNEGLTNVLWEFSPAIRQWTWVSGSQMLNAAGVYGTKGVASTQNIPPARDVASCWGDAAGNIWIFGGSGVDPFQGGAIFWLNDLWMFAPSTKEWTWVSGSNAPNAVSVYGTLGVAAASNVPSARVRPANWIDKSGNLWLFGGISNEGNPDSEALYNDMWRFSPANGDWTWMSGSQTSGSPSVYGALLQASPGSTPGEREGNAAWVSSDGALWLYGQENSEGGLDDVWRYQP